MESSNYIFTLHSRETSILKEIQAFFGGIGNITFHKDTVHYRVQDMESIRNVIIPHFDKYPLESAKMIDYKLWKQCVYLKTAENKLSLEGLEQIISIRGAINLGVSDKLKLTFLHVKVIPRPEFVVNEGRLNPHWVSGFSCGDCSFTFSITENLIRASYAIHLHKREEPLLLKIMERLDLKI